MASSLSASLASGWNSMMAARASANACLRRRSVSLASALSSAGSSAASCDLNTDCAAAMRLAGSGDSSVRLAERGLDMYGVACC